MKRDDVVKDVLLEKSQKPSNSEGKGYASANVALIKYWGKRDLDLNLPYSTSLSISLSHYGTQTVIKQSTIDHDQIFINNQPVELDTQFSRRLRKYLDLFRNDVIKFFHINTESSVPIAAGVASSASGFAALVNALNQFFGWDLEEKYLSILARLGSGSACRSIWPGFVEWQVGHEPNGMDSYGVPLYDEWSEFRVGLLLIEKKEKPISSREAMKRTVSTSPFYKPWQDHAKKQLEEIKQAISARNFTKVGSIAEQNSIGMHATMYTSWPPIMYSLEKTFTLIKRVWQLRKRGNSIYFTQDAGPNLKLLFLEDDTAIIQKNFPGIIIINPFTQMESTHAK